MNRKHLTDKKHYPHFIFSAAVILFLFTRLFNLTILPIFTDEAVYIRWAKMINEDVHNIWSPIEIDNKKPLLMWLIAVALNVFQGPLWAARFVSVTAGFFSLIAVYLIGNRLHSYIVGCLFAFFYIFSPYHLFYDRMAHQAALLNCLFLWLIWLTFKLMLNEEKVKNKYYLMLGLLIGLSLLTKATAVLFVFTPLMLKLIIFRKNSSVPWKLLLPSYIFGLMIAGFPYGILFITSSSFSVKNFLIPSTHSMGQASIAEMLYKMPEKIYQSIGGPFDYFFTYLTYPVLLLAFLFFIFQIKCFSKKHLIILFYFLISFLLLTATAGRGFSRYFLFCATPIIIWAAFALHDLTGFLRERLPQKSFYLTMAIILSILLSHPLSFNYKLLTQPSEAPLVSRDYEQYISNKFSGYGIPEAIDFFKKVSKNKKIIIFTTSNWGNPADSMYVYLSDYPNIAVRRAFWVFEKKLLSDESQINKLSDVYFICRSPVYPRSLFLMRNKNFQFIKSFKKPNSTVFFDIYKRV